MHSSIVFLPRSSGEHRFECLLQFGAILKGSFSIAKMTPWFSHSDFAGKIFRVSYIAILLYYPIVNAIAANSCYLISNKNRISIASNTNFKTCADSCIHRKTQCQLHTESIQRLIHAHATDGASFLLKVRITVCMCVNSKRTFSTVARMACCIRIESIQW